MRSMLCTLPQAGALGQSPAPTAPLLAFAVRAIRKAVGPPRAALIAAQLHRHLVQGTPAFRRRRGLRLAVGSGQGLLDGLLDYGLQVSLEEGRCAPCADAVAPKGGRCRR